MLFSENHRLSVHWFTLVELIVVITVLAILGTIWFVSLQSYSVSARDSTRISDINTISRTLEYFKLQEGYYPNPTDFFEITYSWSLVWRQWIFWEDTKVEARRLSSIPTDPLTWNEYTYSVTNNRQEFELWAITESITSYQLNITLQANASNNYFSYIKWNYNKQIVVVQQAPNIYILWIPTLITTESASTSVQDIFSNQSFSVKNSHNLAHSYANKLPNNQTHTWSISFIPWSTTLVSPLIYEWNLSDLNNDIQKNQFGIDLVSYYSDSNISIQDIYQNISSINPWEELAYVNILIKTNTWGIPWDVITVNDISSIVTDEKCYDPINIWVIWQWFGCNNMLIASESLLKSAWWTFNGWDSSYQIVGPDSQIYTFNDSARNIFTWNITDFSQLFRNAWTSNNFNWDIWYWDMTRAQNTSYMFYGSTSFNQDIGIWDVANVENSAFMFYNANDFDQDISSWDTSKVVRMEWMLNRASSFNQDIGTWDVWEVTHIFWMFYNASSFNQNLSSWDTQNIQRMQNLFRWATIFDQDISLWDVSSITNYSDYDLWASLLWLPAEKPCFWTLTDTNSDGKLNCLD